MAVKEPGWILEAPGKRKVEIKDENGDDEGKQIKKGVRNPAPTPTAWTKWV